nr:ATP phosphoribosyltransferase [Campylobacter sp.]
MLKVALPKGRIADKTLEIFSEIFNDDFGFEDRKLKMQKGEFEFYMVRNQDIPTYVNFGAADIGVVGLDVLEEQQSDVLRLLDLKFGVCDVCIGIKENETLNYNKPQLRVATKMPNITRAYFSSKAIPVKIIKLYGSIELAPLVNLSDCIVDLVETGATMKQNGLKPVQKIMTSSAYLIANKNSFVTKRDKILSLHQKISEKIG